MKLNILVQEKTWEEDGYEQFDDLDLNLYNIEYAKCIPFSDDFVDKVQTWPDVVFGSGRFVDICRNKLFPTFLSFGPKPVFAYKGCDWLNENCEITTIGDLKKYKIFGPIFIKPYTEKLFTGQVVYSRDDLEKIQFVQRNKPLDDEFIIKTSAKKVGQEARFFIVCGCVVAQSYYGRGKTDFPEVSKEHIRLVQNLVDGSAPPDIAFVIDVCFEPEFKIVELNNFNSSGFYGCNLKHIVMALRLLKEIRKINERD